MSNVQYLVSAVFKKKKKTVIRKSYVPKARISGVGSEIFLGPQCMLIIALCF